MRSKQKYVLSLRAEVHLRTRISLCPAPVAGFQIHALPCFVSATFNRLNSALSLYISLLQNVLYSYRINDDPDFQEQAASMSNY